MMRWWKEGNEKRGGARRASGSLSESSFLREQRSAAAIVSGQGASGKGSISEQSIGNRLAAKGNLLGGGGERDRAANQLAARRNRLAVIFNP